MECCDESNGQLSTMAVVGHLLKATVEWQKAGLPLVNGEPYKDRLAQCKSCAEYARFQCRLCRCLVVTKAKLATETCPRGRWAVVNVA